MSKLNRVLAGVLIALTVTLTFGTPSATVEAKPAARQITITIPEAQLVRFLRSERLIGYKINGDIIDGGFLIKYEDNTGELNFNLAYGILIRDGKIVTEPGVIDFPGIGAMGFQQMLVEFPEFAAGLTRSGVNINRWVLRQVSAKAGTRYVPISITIGADQIVIVVER